MSLFSFDIDDHPALRDRAASIDDGESSTTAPATSPIKEITRSLNKLQLHITTSASGTSTPDEGPQPAFSRSTDTSAYEVPLSEPYVASGEPRSKIGVDDFETLKFIGRGAYGKVLLVRHTVSGTLYAMKVLKKASIVVKAKDTEHTKAERQILEEVQHPFIVKLHYAFQTQNRLYLILEYAQGGELFTHLATERMFAEDVASFYIAELVLALEHLHSLGIIYRDLKPENCLLDAEGHILLTDFGLSKVSVDGTGGGEDGKAATMCGTVEYMAPEVLMEMRYDRTVDWWSLGIMLFDMLTGSPPFIGGNKKKTMDSILKKKLNLPYYLSPDAKDLLSRLLRKNPNVRLGSGEAGVRAIKSHRFFRKVDWNKLEKKETEPPIVPVVTSPEAAENFDTRFTTMPIVESPVTPSPLSSSYSALFQGFSYVAPALLEGQGVLGR